jgi:hypothetical protein
MHHREAVYKVVREIEGSFNQQNGHLALIPQSEDGAADVPNDGG